MAVKKKKVKKGVSQFRNAVAGNAKKQRKQGSQYGYLQLPRGVNVFKETPDSRVRLDIIPYIVTDPKHPDRDTEDGTALVGNIWYKRPYYLHRNVGSGNDAVVCPTSIGLPCPICEWRARRKKEGADDEEVKTLKASLRNLYIVMPKGHKEYEEKPHIWDISQYNFQNQLNEEIDEDEDNAIFPDLEEGKTLRIRFSEKAIGKNKFAETSRIDFEDRDEPYDEKILKEAPNLDEILTIYPYEKVEQMFFDMPSEVVELEDEPEEEDEKPRKKHPKRKMKRAKPEPEEEEEDEPEEEEEEDEPEEEEEEDEPEEEEEEDEPEEEEEDEDEEDEPEEEEEDEDEEEPVKPKRSRALREDPDFKPKKSKTKEEGDKCPYGHKFGVDCERFDECDECELWEECIEVKEANKKKKGK